MALFGIGVLIFEMADCELLADGLPVEPVKNEPWQKRARRAGLTQSELATLAGVRENTVSDGLRGLTKDGSVPLYLQTIICLWEISDRSAREAMLGRLARGEPHA